MAGSPGENDGSGPTGSRTVAAWQDERDYAANLIRRIVAACPLRQAASDDELRAQQMLDHELRAAGLQTELRPFRYSTNLYAVLALHGAVGTLGSVVLLCSTLPVAALALHLIAGLSLVADLSRSAHLLRRLLPWRSSHNLIGTLPPARTRGNTGPRLRLVVGGHADAAFTGVLFHPTTIRIATRPPPRPLRFLRKTMLLPAAALWLLAGIDLLAWTAPAATASWAVTASVVLLTIPVAMTLLFNAEVLLRHRLVPGANDNLSACAALPILARRLAPDLPDDVELVLVSTGAEEAGTGGAYALARSGVWDRQRTVFLALDSISNGQLRSFQDGELWRVLPPRWLREAIAETAASEPRFAQVTPFDLPAGATDALPFLRHGYQAAALGCVDPEIGAPRHYHLSSDTPDNLDLDQLMLSIDFAEALLRRIIAARTVFAASGESRQQQPGRGRAAQPG